MLVCIAAAASAQDGTHYFPLDQINRGNVARLHPVWEWQTGEQPLPRDRVPNEVDVAIEMKAERVRADASHRQHCRNGGQQGHGREGGRGSRDRGRHPGQHRILQGRHQPQKADGSEGQERRDEAGSTASDGRAGRSVQGRSAVRPCTAESPSRPSQRQ